MRNRRFQFLIRRWPENTADTRYFHTYGYYDMILRRAPHAPQRWVIRSITQSVSRNEGSPELHGGCRCAHDRTRESRAD
jgi:hypothetical protein